MSQSNLISALVVLLSVVCGGCGGKPPGQHYEKAGGFSYDPPDGWLIVEFPGLKYRISQGPRENEFAPNINIVDEKSSGTLTAYVDANLETMQKAFTNLQVLKREEFQTEDGQSAIRLTTENEQRGHMLRQTFCFFGGAARKYVVTCTALAEGGEDLDAVFAKSMKTFRTH